VVDALTEAGSMSEDWTGEDRAREVRSLLILEATPGVGLRRLRALVDAFGSGTVALRAPFASFARIAGRAAAEARLDAGTANRVDRAIDHAGRGGVRMVVWGDRNYPRRLMHLADPPPVLFVRGDPKLLVRGGVTVIGSRRATARGRELSVALAGALCRRGMPVISGLALGIDGAAHRGALAVGGRTVAVLGSGVDRPSPSSHASLARRILAQGALVSEFLPGSPPRPHHFPRRNRVLAALSDAVVVVEAGLRSGTLITVEHALDLGIEVFAVPGPEHRPSCAGSNRLLAEGAEPLRDPDAFAAALAARAAGPTQVLGAQGRERASGPRPTARDRVSAASASSVAPVLAALDHEAVTVEQLIERTGLPVAPVVSVLCELELLGRVEQGPGQRYRRAS